MDWQRGNDWYIFATHKRRKYFISKCLVAGVPRYTAWHHDMIAKPRMSLDEAKQDVMEQMK